MKSIRPFLTVTFWTGCVLFALGQFITFYPGVETTWFAVAAGLCLCGFLVRSRRYSIAAFFFVAAGIALSVWGYRHGQEYQAWLKQQPSKEEQIRRLGEQLRMLDNTNAEPGGAANRSQPAGLSTNQTSAIKGQPIAWVISRRLAGHIPSCPWPALATEPLCM